MYERKKEHGAHEPDLIRIDVTSNIPPTFSNDVSWQKGREEAEDDEKDREGDECVPRREAGRCNNEI